jgi:hypothetical protein
VLYIYIYVNERIYKWWLDVILTDAINGFSSQHLLFKELERNGELNAEFGHFEAPKVNCLIYIL